MFIFPLKNLARKGFMLGLHWTPEGLGTDLRPKNGQTRGYLEFWSARSIVTHQKVVSYSLNTRNNIGLLAFEINKLHNHF